MLTLKMEQAIRNRPIASYGTGTYLIQVTGSVGFAMCIA